MNLQILTNFANDAADAEAKGGFGALGVDARAFIIQLITWILVFLVLRKYVFGPVVRLLQKRQDTIEKGVELTTQMTAERDRLEQEVDKTMKKARSEADKILTLTREQSAQIVKDAEEEAKAKTEVMIKEAKTKIADETAKARRTLEKDMVNLVIQATEVVAGEKIDASKDASLINKALKAEI